MAYSLDLRRRVMALYDETGGNASAVARTLKVSHTFVDKLVKLWRATGSLDTHYEHNGRPPRITAEAQQWLREWLTEQNDLTLAQLRFRLRQRGIKVCQTTIGNALAAMAFTRKKKRLLPPNNAVPKSKRRDKNGIAKRSPRFPPNA